MLAGDHLGIFDTHLRETIDDRARQVAIEEQPPDELVTPWPAVLGGREPVIVTAVDLTAGVTLTIRRGPSAYQHDAGATLSHALFHQGLDGQQGDTGTQGDRGGLGPRGSQGEPGDSGERGEQGEIGPRGPGGPRGAQGDQGARGEAGEQGDRGDVGPRGSTGPRGDQGPQGEQGQQGVPGVRGDRGPRGERGPQGELGPEGQRGRPGERGPQGETRVAVRWRKDYSEAIAYDQGDGVRAGDGLLYISAVDGNQANDPTADQGEHWMLFTAAAST